VRISPPFVALILCSLLFGWQSLADHGPRLRAIVSDTNAPPYGIFNQEGRLVGGIAKDMLDSLAKRLGLEVDYFDLPRPRVEQWLQNGDADIACFLNPDWVSEPDKLNWSPVLFTTQQVIVRRKASPPILQPENLYGLRVGTIRGFVYPELTALFTEGRVIRDDAQSFDSNLERLARGRLDAVMAVDMTYWHFLSDEWQQQLDIDPLWSTATPVYCAVYEATHSAPIRQALQIMVDNGDIQRMLDRYRR